MKSILRSTAVLSSSSVVTIIVGLVSAKAFALLIGPTGLGYMGLLQSLVGLAGLVTGMGIGTGLVRMGAEALEQQNVIKVAALRRAAWSLFWTFGGGAFLLLALIREPVSRYMLGGVEHAGAVVLMGLALLFSLASGLQTSTLNAHHRVGALAKVGIVNSVLGTLIAVSAVWFLGERGITAAVIGMSVVSWAVSRFFLARAINLPETRSTERPSLSETWAAARALLRFGGPYTLSMLTGTGVGLILPVLVLNALGHESVGYFRAASAVSVTYLGFLLSAMALDYFPRLSSVSAQPARLIELINQQHRLVMLLGAPMILGMLALSPYLVPLVYSPEFMPAVTVLEWQLIGDILKFSSWTLSFAVLARSGSLIFFVTEVIGGGSYLLASLLGMHWLGLTGLGLGHLVSYAVYLGAVWLVMQKQIGFVLSPENKRLLLGTLLIALLPRLLPLIGLTELQLPVALLGATAVGVSSLFTIWREVGGKSYARAG